MRRGTWYSSLSVSKNDDTVNSGQWHGQVHWPGTLAHSRACVRLHDMSGTNMVLWPGMCPARPGLRYTTDLGEATATNYFVCM